MRGAAAVQKVALKAGTFGLVRRSWIVTSELNVSDWPGYDLHPSKAPDGPYWRYGRLSDALRAKVEAAMVDLIRSGRARLIPRR